MMFMIPGEIRRCSSEELTTMLEEAGEASKHARKLGKVMGIVAAHRLKQMRELLMYEELAIWRRENGFDRAEELFLCSSLASAHSGAILCRLVVRGECVERCNFDAAPESQQTHQRN